MRICKSVPVALLAFCFNIFVCQFCGAQATFSGPSGGFANNVSGATNAVWDIPAIQNIRIVSYQVLNAHLQPAATVYYQVNIGQEGGGNLFGSGRSLVQVSYSTNGSNFISAPSFVASYGTMGKITSSRGIARGFIMQTVLGPAFLTRTNKQVVVFTTDRTDFIFNNVSNTVLVKVTDTFSAAGLGSFRNRATNGPSPLSLLGAGNGTWMLKMNLQTDARKRVTGNAVVALNSGRIFDFKVTGVFKPATGQSRLVLSGHNVFSTNAVPRFSGGSSLQVTMTGNSVAAIKGKLSGQLVNASGADISPPLPTGTVSFWTDTQTTGPIGVGESLGQRVTALIPSLSLTNHEFPGMTSTVVASSMLASGEQTNATVLWVGNNNFNDTNTVVGDISAMVSSLSNKTAFLVLGLINSANEPVGSPELDQILFLNNTLSNAYGSHYVDTRLPLLAAASTNAQDQTDVAFGVIPTSLRLGATNLSDSAYAILSTNIANALRTVITRSP
ncbi:MAG TPA: hypothetical protein VFD66_14220 [Verrucomicrobiae bacterium]|nr:hypothetical protein [Verrucomicrobiae bacterium]